MVMMMASNSESVSNEDVPEVPHQPGADFSFPKRSFGKKATSILVLLVQEVAILALQ